MQVSECVVHLSNAMFIHAMPMLSSTSVLSFASPWVTTLCNRWQQHLLQSDIPSLLDAPRPLNALLTFPPASVTNVGHQPTKLYLCSSFWASPATTGHTGHVPHATRSQIGWFINKYSPKDTQALCHRVWHKNMADRMPHLRGLFLVPPWGHSLVSAAASSIGRWRSRQGASSPPPSAWLR